MANRNAFNMRGLLAKLRVGRPEETPILLPSLEPPGFDPYYKRNGGLGFIATLRNKE